MEITSDYGDKVTAINCRVFGTEVVALDELGDQAMVRIGLALKASPDLMVSRNAPPNCPLTIEPRERELGNFTVCQSCPNSIIESDGLTEV